MPSAFEVLWVSLTLDAAGSQNVDELEDVITGQATVFFSSTRGSDPIAIRVNVASSASVAGVGPVVMGVVADSSDLSVLYGRLVGGDFHVGLRGVTDRTGSDDFSMDVRVSVRATAFCD